MNNDILVAIIAGLAIVVIGVGAAVSSFAPDVNAQRIAACMTQPDMEYRHGYGCVRIQQ